MGRPPSNAHRPTFIRLLHQHDGNKDLFVDQNWTKIIDSHIKSIRCIHESNLQAAFDEKANASNELAKLLQAQRESNWCIGFMHKHSVNLRRLAIKADADADIKRRAELERERAKADDNIPRSTEGEIKKVAKLADSHLVDIQTILAAVRMVQPDEDVVIEEVHCILSNLIYEGKIKGYLSIAHQKLVLSKTNPFPPIGELVK